MLEARIGFSPDDGRTEVRLFGSVQRAHALQVGARDYVERDVSSSATTAAANLVQLRPNGDSVFVVSTDGLPLQLKPQFGGTVLASHYSFLPTGASGDPADVIAALSRNAGQFDTSPTAGESDSGLSSTPKTGAILANVRRELGGGIEAYADAVLLWNSGRAITRDVSYRAFLPADGPSNPFRQDLLIAYPVEEAGSERRARLRTARYTLGAVTPLPFAWRGSADVTLGSSRYDYEERATTFDVFAAERIRDLAPLGSWDAVQAALAPALARRTTLQTITNRYRNVSARVAGPLFDTREGPSTLTLLAERRVEDVPAYVSQVIPQSAAAQITVVAPRRTTTTSVYGELKTRLWGDEALTPVLRNLETQLAVRRDVETDRFSRDPRQPASERLDARFAATVYTVGAKVSPTPWLLLRASYATGQTPPALSDLIETTSAAPRVSGVVDPKRGRQFIVNGPNYVRRFGGSPDLEAVRASTVSLGGILSPLGETGPRLTVDWSRIHRRRDVFRPSDQLVLDREDAWRERVQRAPLTDADRARGFTGGQITGMDVRAGNGAELTVETVDARLDWATSLAAGVLRLYGDATYSIRNVQTSPFQSPQDRVDYLLGPLSRRGNIGAEWSRGSISIGANVQHFGSYRIYPAGTSAFIASLGEGVQGSGRVPSQTYLDLHAAWRHRLPAGSFGRDIAVDLGVVNVLDSAPPRESAFSLSQYAATIGSYAPGYSRYGDPRQRRFVLTLSAGF